MNDVDKDTGAAKSTKSTPDPVAAGPDTDGGSVPHPHTTDILAELEAEVAQEMEEERPPAGGPLYQVAGSVVGIAIGVTGAVLAWDYGLGSLEKPGAGLWPFIVSVLIAVLSIGLLVAGRGLGDSEAFTRSSLLPIAGIVTFIAFGFLMPLVGFEIPALALAVVWLKFLGGETWRNTAIISVVTVAAFYFLFLYGLQIPLPHLINL